MKSLFGALALVICMAGPALAADIPAYDIKETCREIAAAGGGSKMIELQCRKDEAASQKRLQKASVPADTMRTCDQISQTLGAGSYMLLEQCIKDELDAAAQLQ